jgi:hypothetical protein
LPIVSQLHIEELHFMQPGANKTFVLPVLIGLQIEYQGPIKRLQNEVSVLFHVISFCGI